MKRRRPTAPHIRDNEAEDEPYTAPTRPLPTRTYLTRLATVLMNSGWATLPRYDDPIPVLHVYAAAVPNLGETVSVVPGPTPHEHWFRSSTGAFLAPCTHPTKAAATVAAILSPYIDAALSHHTPQQSTPTKRPESTITWWGEQTRQWWALVPNGNSASLLSANTREDLAQAITQARP